jgi:putative transposase
MERKAMLDADDNRLSMRQQCQLLKLNRSSLYYQSKPEGSDNVELMRL